MASSRPGWILGHHYLDFKGWPEQSSDRLCWHSSDHTEPAPTFSAGALPNTHSGKGHKAIHQQNTDLPQANPFHRKQNAGEKQSWLPREGFAFPQQIAGSWGQILAQNLPAALKRCSTTTSKPKPDPLLDGGWGGGPSAAHPSRSKDFSSLLDSSHPSEKVPLLPVFYETPTHQPSNCSQHVLWFYVSNKKQLHLHKTCSFLSRLSPRGWSGTGRKASLSAGTPTPLMALPRHRDTRKWPLPSSFSACSCQNDTTTNL